MPGLEEAVFVFRARDRTTENKQFRQRIIAVTKKDDEWRMLRDWELLLLLNSFEKSLNLKKVTAATGMPPKMI